MSDCEFFQLKYLEDIYQLFKDCQEISAHNNLDLLLQKDDNFMDLYDLIYESVAIKEVDPIEEQDDEEY